MDSSEAKRALMSERPVIHRDIEYKCVSAVIYRKKKKGKRRTIDVTVELTDKSAEHSVSIAPINEVTFP